MGKRKKQNTIHLHEDHVEIIIESQKYGTFKVLVDKEDWRTLNEKYENLTLRISKRDRSHEKRYKSYPYVVATYGAYASGPTHGSDGKFVAAETPSQRKDQHLQRLIMETPPRMVTDHINGDTLDNRRSNLRICTNAENSRNCARVTTSRSGYKGVHCAKANRSKLPWRARIKHNYIEIQLGTFATKEEAARAYDKKAIELFGEFASLNFPEDKQ